MGRTWRGEPPLRKLDRRLGDGINSLVNDDLFVGRSDSTVGASEDSSIITPECRWSATAKAKMLKASQEGSSRGLCN